MGITLATKCAVDEKIFIDISEAGIGAVELYTSIRSLHNLKEVKQGCKKFQFRYTVHVPNASLQTLSEFKSLNEFVKNGK